MGGVGKQEKYAKGNGNLVSLVGPSSLGGQKNRGLMVDVNLSRISDVQERSADGLKHAIKQA
jgi:hypothetical protein